MRQSIALRGAIFDMDGTILDSMPCWETVGLRYLLDRHIPVPDADGLARRLKTTTLPQAAQLYRDEFGITDDIPRICAEISSTVASPFGFPASASMIRLAAFSLISGSSSCIVRA